MKDYDPRMHSAEHILNQTMDRMYHRGRAFSAHVERKKSKCDYHFDRNLDGAEVTAIERAVNEIIASNLRVREEFVTKGEAAKQFNLGRLPEETGDVLRIIKIGDYDACPCSGKHVTTTEEIGTFSIISTSYENGVLRIRFKLNDK